MTETPKCPYCGAELEVTHAFVSDATAAHKLVYTCFCRECGVYTPKRSTLEEALSAALRRAEPCESYQQLSKALCDKENATLKELLNAVEQLKRRAEPENRVLTLEEAQNICCFSGGVWLEEKAGFMALAHVSHADAETDTCQIYTFFANFRGIAGNYGKTWRCWMRRPTEKARKREKWEE